MLSHRLVLPMCVGSLFGVAIAPIPFFAGAAIGIAIGTVGYVVSNICDWLYDRWSGISRKTESSKSFNLTVGDVFVSFVTFAVIGTLKILGNQPQKTDESIPVHEPIKTNITLSDEAGMLLLLCLLAIRADKKDQSSST